MKRENDVVACDCQKVRTTVNHHWVKQECRNWGVKASQSYKSTTDRYDPVEPLFYIAALRLD